MDIVTVPALQALDVAERPGGGGDLSVSRLDEVVVVRVSGEVDLHTGPALRAVLRDLLAPAVAQADDHGGAGAAPRGEGARGRAAGGRSPDRVRAVVVDLAGVGFIDSYALGVLVQGHRWARPGGRAYAVVATHEMIHTLFAVTGLARVMPLHPDVASAVRHLRAAQEAAPA